VAHHVLDDLVFHHSQFGFFNRQAGKVLGLLKPRQHHRLDDAVNVFLRELGKDGGGGFGLTDQALQVSNAFFTQAFTSISALRVIDRMPG
jgi:hypothetical protein